MPTERDVLQHITEGRSEGFAELFHRHAALFHEGLSRFWGESGPDQAEILIKVMQRMRSDLKAGKFEDLEETFYDWVVRDAWCTMMELRIDEEGGDHLDPAWIYECADRLNEAALPDEVREKCRKHFEECALCSELLAQCKDLTVEIRHAGAPYPEAFDQVIEKVLAGLAG